MLAEGIPVRMVMTVPMGTMMMMRMSLADWRNSNHGQSYQNRTFHWGIGLGSWGGWDFWFLFFAGKKWDIQVRIP